jgi:uncharacterized RDD family membrane protein YckC
VLTARPDLSSRFREYQDGLIRNFALPFGAFVTRVPWRSEGGFVISQLAGLIIALLFQVFLVKRFGGSPGKIILKMRITKLDGGPVGYKEAGIRYSVLRPCFRWVLLWQL